jgi:predicted nucleotidyltransferase
MFQRERDVLAEIGARLADHPSVLQAIAYGSRIRGEERSDSDFDILLVVAAKDRAVKDALRDWFYRYELESGLSFSVAILTREDVATNERLGSPFFKTVRSEGVAFYDAESRGETRLVAVPPRQG